MDIRWLTAFIDRPDAELAPALEFWAVATASDPSPFRGEGDQFTTLVPRAGGDAHLRLQRTRDGTGGTHLDLHVDDVAAATAAALGSGAAEVQRGESHVALRSPGGYPFCFVEHRGEATRTRPVDGEHRASRTLVDQLCLDVPADRYEAEIEFWAAVTGWPVRPTSADEFTALVRPRRAPLRLLFQRLGDGHGGAAVSGHLDLACDDVRSAVVTHTALGATVRDERQWWTVMTDPSGHSYCLTSRDPDTGLIRQLR